MIGLILSFFLIAILNALYIKGLWGAFQYETEEETTYTDHFEVVKKDVVIEKSILWFVKYWLDINLPEFIVKPIAGCMRCMASVHSTYIFWPIVLQFGFSIWLFPLWILYVAILSGIITQLNEL